MAAAPDFIARYEVKQCLGRGGMGAIYLARDPLIDRLVAVKLLHADIAGDEFRARFVQEAHASGALSHPHIVTIHDYGEADGAPFIVMEYVRGETLAAIIRRAAPIPVVQKLTWTEQICSALGYAHREHVIHRDIKPSNLMLDQHGTIRVVDFGIARLVGGVSTKMSAVIGTPGYMSPEQIQGGTIDARSDIFALGTVLYELLSYREAFKGDTPHVVMHRVIAGQPTPLADILAGPDLSIVPVVETAMQKDPARRYQSMAEFEAAVRAARTALEHTGHDLTAHEPRPADRMRSRRRTDPADLARRRADQIQQHIDRARRAKGAGDFDAAVAACEDALLMDPGSAEALDLLDAIRHEAPSIGPPPASPKPPPAAPAPERRPTPRTPIAVLQPSRPAVIAAPQAEPTRADPPAAPPDPPRHDAPPHPDAARSEPARPAPQSVRPVSGRSMPADLPLDPTDPTDVGEQPIRPWESGAWGQPPIVPPPPVAIAPPSRWRSLLIGSGSALVTAAALAWAAASGALTSRSSVLSDVDAPAPLDVGSTTPTAAPATDPTAAVVTEPAVVPAAAESAPSGPAIQDGKAAAEPPPADPPPAGDVPRSPAPRPVDPNAIVRAMQRADAARTAGDLAQALALYREVLRLDPGNVQAERAMTRIRLDYLLQRARSLIQAEDYAAALRDLDSVAAEDPANQDAAAMRQEIARLSAVPRKPKG